MSILVCVGLSGERLHVDANAITTLDALKAWIHQQVNIHPRAQVLLTGQGKQVRNQALLTETELFVFDSARLTATVSPESSFSSAATVDFDPGSPPDGIDSTDDLEAWKELFHLRRRWARGLLDGCQAKARQAERYQDAQVVIERSLRVAMASLQQHIKGAEQKLGTVKSWAAGVLRERRQQLDSWETSFDNLREIPARAEFTRFIQPMTPTLRRISQQSGISTLQAFVDGGGLKDAAASVEALANGFENNLKRMRTDLDVASRGTDQLLQDVDRIGANSCTNHTSESGQLLEEIEMVAKKMESDHEHVSSLPHSSQSVSQASKRAQLHTRSYLPNLNEYCSEMNEMVQHGRRRRNSATDTALEHMRKLSGVETILAELHQSIKSIDVPADEQQAFATLAIVSRLPSVYGALLVESVRRREWVAKMRRDASTLQEEVATYQEEEDKRRKRWVRSVEDVVKLDALQSSVLGIELSLQNEGGSWPMVTRDELQNHLQILTDLYGQCGVTQEMEQAIQDLDKPTRKQIRHAKAFKNGSMHEAAFGDTSLFLRGDEQHKALRDTNSRLEDEVKGQKSRVRKLEDLLYRQTHMARVGSGDVFTPQSGSTFDRVTGSFAASPPDGILRQNSIKHVRRPSVQAIEEKKLARRIVDLESQLNAAKEEVTTLQTSDVDTQKQIEEATSTKRDLMENMEAQQREFATERRHLERDLTEAKDRVEEMENEIERVLGSREDERTGAEARIAALEGEVVQLREDSTGHAARAATHHDSWKALERKLEIAENARAQAEAEVQKLRAEQEHWQETDAERIQMLGVAHSHLSSDATPPTELTALTAALEALARRSGAHAKDLEDAVLFAKSENESLWSSNERHKHELATASQKNDAAEDRLRQMQEQLSSEEARAHSFEQQLGEEQGQLRMLREKFAEGETGSEVLRQRVAEEESRAGKLAAELAEARSHANGLEVELTRLQKRQQVDSESADEFSERSVKLAERAKEVSHRLYSQQSRLNRLLERLGLAVSHPENVMVVERASKMNASTTIEAHGQLIRAASLSSPPGMSKSSALDEGSVDLSALCWPDTPSAEEETQQFSAFVSHLNRFNVDTFADAVLKRVRDFEYTAKKYNKEARESSKRADGYKERCLRVRAEAHAKLAVKDFKEGDLALFLPTRGQAKGAWAAFNIGCPHYFLAERDGMKLGARDFIVARIQRVEQRIVDLTRNNSSPPADDPATRAKRENPFDLSDGLTWWMVHATEERGAPATPGLGKSTVAAANVDARGKMGIQRGLFSKGDDASTQLNRSLESRRSSSTSKKSVAAPLLAAAAAAAPAATTPTGPGVIDDPKSAPAPSGLAITAPNAASSISAPPPHRPSSPLTPAQDPQVRTDLLWGP